jgi:CheY-like chemotaxis protein
MNGKVLVVDDDPGFRDLLADLLIVDGGVDVALAEDGDEALDQMRLVRPGLVLLDIKMPNIDGLEFLRYVRADPLLADIPVVAITATGPVDIVRAKAMDAGCADFLAKPFALADLLSVVAAWLPAPTHADGR